MKKISRRNFLHASALAGAALVSSLAAPAAFAEETPAAAGVQPIARDLGWKTVSDTVYSYSVLDNVLLAHRSDVVIPTYYIFAGRKNQQEAVDLVENQLQMMGNVNEWGGSVYVISPIGDRYTEADVQALKDLVARAAKNVKVIGIDEGATFVNNELSRQCYFVAGVMTWGGEMSADAQLSDCLPAYLSNAGSTAKAAYRAANRGHGPLAVTVTGSDANLAEAFRNAWDKVFSRNYRMHNSVTEFYNLPLDGRNFNGTIMEGAFDYDLCPLPQFDRLGVSYNEMIGQPVTGMPGSYAWYEIVPYSVLEKEDGTVPLVVTMHGNYNDLRLQIDTSGWTELAGKEDIIVVSPEWQEGTDFARTYGVNGLESEGVVALVGDLALKYPQIDRSRVYVTGLSAGGAHSFYMGLAYSNVFAAAAPISGVNAMDDEIAQLDLSQVHEIPLLYICGDHDYFQMIPVDGSSPYGMSLLTDGQVSMWADDPHTHIWSAIQAYRTVNGLPLTEMDMTANPYYGIALDDQRWVTLGDKEMYTGTLSNDKGVMIELAAVKDLAHWNYAPEAEYVYDFFKNYSRDLETGELIVHDPTILEQFADWCGDVADDLSTRLGL